MAIIIFGMFFLGVWMVALGYYDRWYHDAPYIHKSLGILLLLMLVLRWLWRCFNVQPKLMGKTWERLVALSVHRLHYLLLFTVMVSGYLIPTAEGVGIDVFGWFTVPSIISLQQNEADWMGMIHRYAAWSVMALAGLHAGAALKHHIMDKDHTLLRILGISQKQKEQ